MLSSFPALIAGVSEGLLVISVGVCDAGRGRVGCGLADSP